MERLVKGDVVVLPFPFSDLSAVKKRPALVVTVLPGDDFILAQITSRERQDAYAIRLEKDDFQEGGLPVVSNVRPNKLFTANRIVLDYVAGHLRPGPLSRVVDEVCRIIRT